MSTFPKAIERMIRNYHLKGWKAERIAAKVNASKTASNLGVSYTTRTISAKLANLTRSR